MNKEKFDSNEDQFESDSWLVPHPTNPYVKIPKVPALRLEETEKIDGVE